MLGVCVTLRYVYDQYVTCPYERIVTMPRQKETNMSENIRRYGWIAALSRMVVCDDGGWVVYDDHLVETAKAAEVAVQKERDKMRTMVRAIVERRGMSECWYTDGNCGNYTSCLPRCPLRQLMDACGIYPREDGKIPAK